MGEKHVGSESQVRLGRTTYAVKIAGAGKFRKRSVLIARTLVPQYLCLYLESCLGTKREMEMLETQYIAGDYNPFSTTAQTESREASESAQDTAPRPQPMPEDTSETAAQPGTVARTKRSAGKLSIFVFCFDIMFNCK